MSEFLHSSDIAFFHNQKHGDSTSDFNSKYAVNSPELYTVYSSETVKNTFQPIIETLNTKFPHLSEIKILEIGGSTGLLSRYLQDQGAQVTMLETQPLFVDKAKERGVNAKLYSGSNLFSVINHIKFDVVIANRVFEDIVMPEYQAKNLIRQASLIIEPNGFLIIGSQNPSAIWNNSFVINGFSLESSITSLWNPYIKETRVYKQY